MQSVIVRAIASCDVGILERAFPEGSADKHRGRLARQECGEVVYLIAWDAGTPVGHALLKWAGATEPHLVAHFRGTCPDVEDLLVAVDWRSQGIGTQLLTVAARLVSERGYARIGLSVDVRNPRARALYERLGYTDAGMGIHREEGTYVDQQGQLQRWEDICIYLVKPLTGPPPP